MDLYSAVDLLIPPRNRSLVSTDLQLEFPRGCYGRISPRSGLAIHHFLDVGGGDTVVIFERVPKVNIQTSAM